MHIEIYANNKTMKVLFIFRFFHYIWFIDSENLCFILISKETTFNIVHFPNFEISASLQLAPRLPLLNAARNSFRI